MRKDKRARAARRIVKSLYLMARHGPLSGGRTALSSWNSLAHGPVSYASWLRGQRKAEQERAERLADALDDLDRKATFCIIILPGCDGETGEEQDADLATTLSSIRAQSHQRWTCFKPDDLARPTAGSADERIAVDGALKGGQATARINHIAANASADYIILLESGDRLAPDALAALAIEAERLRAAGRTAALIYSDGDRIGGDGRRIDPFFKPAYSRADMLSRDLTAHLTAIHRFTFKRVGGLREDVAEDRFYDLALRSALSARADEIGHCAGLFCTRSRRARRSALAVTPYQAEARTAILRNALAAFPACFPLRGEVEPVMPATPARIAWRIEEEPLVSIIVPTRDRAALVEQCVRGLLDRTDHRRIEVLIADNDSSEPDALALFRRLGEEDGRVRTIACPGPFNYSAINNRAAAEATGEHLLLLNNDTDIIHGDWLGEMIGQLLQPHIGMVGAKLFYGDGRIQHAGVRLGMGTINRGPGVAGHYGLLVDPDERGDHGNYGVVRQVGAVTAACALVRREIFEAVGGFDETNLPIAFNDIDLCLRIREAGHGIVWTPHARVSHLESVSRGSDMRPERFAKFLEEVAYMHRRWGNQLRTDPYYSAAFDPMAPDFVLKV